MDRLERRVAPSDPSKGGIDAAIFYRYCKSKTHKIEQCWRCPSHWKGGLSTSAGTRGSSQ
jgi:hypothetical protein